MLILLSFKVSYYQKKSSTLTTYALKVLSLFVLLLNTVLTIPFVDMFLVTIYCDDADFIGGERVCYSGIYWLHFTFSLFGLILLLIMLPLSNLLYIDLNPCSSTPFAAPQWKNDLFKLALKFALPIYWVFDFRVNFNIIKTNS